MGTPILSLTNLKKAFARRYGDIDDAAVAKITALDDPGKLIRRYRNDALPTVAVTVDLLTTGIDVPKIVNLVFIRRVNSRILYEQMMGGQLVFARKSARRLFAFLMPLTFTMRCTANGYEAGCGQPEADPDPTARRIFAGFRAAIALSCATK